MDIYEALEAMITKIHYFYMANLFTDEYRLKLNESDIPLFDLLKKICSLTKTIDDDRITFAPMFTNKDGSNSFSINDINEQDYQLLDSIELNKLPLALKSYISDILWTQRKDYSASQIAINSYWDIFQILFDHKEYDNSLDSLRRAVCIAAQTNSQTSWSKIYDWFSISFISNVSLVDDFCALRIMELFFEQKNTDYAVLLPALDSIISQSSRNNNVLAVEQAYELKAKCFHKLKLKNDATKSNLLLAQYYFDFAESLLSSDSMGAFRSVGFFKKAIIMFRNNGDTNRAENAHRKLNEVQKQIPEKMHIFTTKYDVSKADENIKTNMEGLSFEECIIRLTQYVGFESVEDLKKRTIEEHKRNPISSLFNSSILDAQGRTIINIPSLDDKEPENDPHLLELHMFRSSLKVQQIIGITWINRILFYIRDKFIIEDEMIEFLVNNNGIVPEGREKIFQKGIGSFLRGEYYEAMHILAPQMENLFRNIANEVGGLTSSLSNDGSSQEKVLSSVFTIPELVDAYENDILFAFRGLLNEQAGANIRNRIAHGMIEEAECSSGEFLYFGAAVIKILSFTARACYKLIVESEKLKAFKQPNSDDVRIIK